MKSSFSLNIGEEAPLSNRVSTFELVLLKAARREVVMTGGVGCETSEEAGKAATVLADLELLAFLSSGCNCQHLAGAC